jgi:hypothetical protein
MINEEIKEKNLSIFLKKLEEIGCNLNLNDEIKNKIKNASFTTTNENGLAYEGSLLNVILRILTPFALKINDVLPDNIKVEKNSLIKICLLSHISKCEMFEPNDNEWEKEKRGMIFKYTKSNVALKMGIKSLILAQQMGVIFTPEEIEAITIMDRRFDDEQVMFFSNPISVVLKQAHELTYLSTRIK